MYDVIVLGLGGMGSAAALELARRGRSVLGLEQFAFGHDRGSSHGRTRIIRKAYFEHPEYVPLLLRAYEKWYDLEQESGQHLLTRCGCLAVGPPESRLISGVRRSSAEHGLPVDVLSTHDLTRRFPAFRPDPGHVGVFERDAGFLPPEACVAAQLRVARERGADLRENSEVLSWEADGAGVTVRAKDGVYRAAKLVVTAGAWATRLLGGLGVPFTILRQVTHWFEPADPRLFRRDRFPCYIMETSGGDFYGFPMVDPGGVKVARHFGGIPVSDPDVVDRTARDEDERQDRHFLERYIPSAAGPRRRGSVCLYTMTPDRHFVIDRHPGQPCVVVAAGFSGHGFKFCPVIGEILADLAEHGRTPHPIGMFRSDRFPHPAS